MSETPQWLDEIQDRSWEPELFVSGGAIFSLWQLTDLLHHRSFLQLQQTGNYEPILIANFVIAALNALIFGFALHLIMRGFWVASITLSYVFPKGIQADKIHYSPKFQAKVQHIRSTVDTVLLLEKICCLIFSLAFFFALIILGLLITLLVLIPHTSLKNDLGENGFLILQIGSYFLLFLGLIYMLDFLTLGFIKKQKSLSKIYYPIYILFSILTLAPLYRTTYYTLVSNLKSRLAVGIAVIYLLIAFVFTHYSRGSLDAIFDIRKFLHINSENAILSSRYYENQRKSEEMVEHASIQSDIVQENYLRLFVVHQKVIENLMQKECNEKNTSPLAMMKCYNEFYRIYINDKYYPKLTWRQYTHPQTGELGMITLIPIKDLPNQESNLKIVLNIRKTEELKKIKEFGMKSATYAQIPFWKN